VLAEPPASGFNLAAWLMPIFALAVGSMIVGVSWCVCGGLPLFPRARAGQCRTFPFQGHAGTAAPAS
jgi:hypothetical protein